MGEEFVVPGQRQGVEIEPASNTVYKIERDTIEGMEAFLRITGRLLSVTPLIKNHVRKETP